MKICSVEDCARAVRAKGMCRPHYESMRKYGTPTAGLRAVQVEVCGIESCSSPGHAIGYCQKHYRRYRKYGDAEAPYRQSMAETLSGKLAEGTPTGLSDDECWEWTKYRSGEGYGSLYYKGKAVAAHRLSYELANAVKVPTGLVVRHTCDNPPCVNPNHLEVGTHLDNARDKITRGRARNLSGELAGSSKLTEVEVLRIRKMYADGSTGTALAKEFGISISTVSQIVHRKTWRHV